MLYDTTLRNGALTLDKVKRFFRDNRLAKFRKIRFAVTNSQSHARHLARNLAGTCWEQPDHLVICFGQSGACMDTMVPRLKAILGFMNRLRKGLRRAKADTRVWVIGPLANDGKFPARGDRQLKLQVAKKTELIKDFVDTLQKHTRPRRTKKLGLFGSNSRTSLSPG